MTEDLGAEIEAVDLAEIKAAVVSMTEEGTIEEVKF
jgi:hypothetical protein